MLYQRIVSSNFHSVPNWQGLKNVSFHTNQCVCHAFSPKCKHVNVNQLRKVDDEIWRKYVDQSLVRRSEARDPVNVYQTPPMVHGSVKNGMSPLVKKNSLHWTMVMGERAILTEVCVNVDSIFSQHYKKIKDCDTELYQIFESIWCKYNVTEVGIVTMWRKLL